MRRKMSSIYLPFNICKPLVIKVGVVVKIVFLILIVAEVVLTQCNSRRNINSGVYIPGFESNPCHVLKNNNNQKKNAKPHH